MGEYTSEGEEGEEKGREVGTAGRVKFCVVCLAAESLCRLESGEWCGAVFTADISPSPRNTRLRLATSGSAHPPAGGVMTQRFKGTSLKYNE